MLLALCIGDIVAVVVDVAVAVAVAVAVVVVVVVDDDMSLLCQRLHRLLQLLLPPKLSMMTMLPPFPP